MTIQLTMYQWRILTFVQGYFAKHSMSPSIEEIAVGVGSNSTSVVNYNLGKLEGVGLLKRRRGTGRSIVLQNTGVSVAVQP